MFMVKLEADSLYSLLGVAPDATFAQIREARDRAVRLLRERQRQEPTNREQLDERQKQVNAAGETLARPAQREKYDEEHAHLRLFMVRPAAAPMFTDPADRIDALHRAMVEHLRAAGVRVPPLTDLDRADFSDDLTPTPLLDGRTGGHHE
jgi:curved DNA-binding protein CbpA